MDEKWKISSNANQYHNSVFSHTYNNEKYVEKWNLHIVFLYFFVFIFPSFLLLSLHPSLFPSFLRQHLTVCLRIVSNLQLFLPLASASHVHYQACFGVCFCLGFWFWVKPSWNSWLSCLSHEHPHFCLSCLLTASPTVHWTLRTISKCILPISCMFETSSQRPLP